MKKVRYTDEQIVEIVRESQAHGVPATAKKFQVSEQSIYIWKRKFGTMDASQVAELKKAQGENARLKKLLAERDLEIEVMKETLSKKW
jgi:putative transposase